MRKKKKNQFLSIIDFSFLGNDWEIDGLLKISKTMISRFLKETN